jgi:hypothetical protein
MLLLTKRSFLALSVYLAVICTFAHPAASAPLPAVQASQKVTILPGSSLKLDGDSTLRKFTSSATKLSLSVSMLPEPQTSKEILKSKLQELDLSIPVVSLKSNSTMLDGHLDDALKADKFPAIHCVVKSYQVKSKNADGSYQITAPVELTLAGATKTVEVDAVATVEGGKVRIQGEKQLLMTDFKVDPPTLLLGTIKTANEIKISFDLLMAVK